MLLLMGCASEPVVRTETEFRYPPTVLMAPCPVPVYNGDTWADVVEYAVQIRQVALSCNADKKALRQWAKSDN